MSLIFVIQVPVCCCFKLGDTTEIPVAINMELGKSLNVEMKTTECNGFSFLSCGIAFKPEQCLRMDVPNCSVSMQYFNKVETSMLFLLQSHELIVGIT